MKARHVFVIAAVFAAVFAAWMIGNTPAAIAQGNTQAHTIRPFGT